MYEARLNTSEDINDIKLSLTFGGGAMHVEKKQLMLQNT